MSVGSALSGFFGLVWRILEGIRKVLHLVLLLVIFGFLLAALHTSIPVVPRSAALVLNPEGELVEQLASDPVRRAFGQASGGPAPETLLKDVVDAIQAAKSDARIKLIVLDLGNLSPSGLSKLQEIGAALRDFRAAGKRVVSASDSLDQTQYYLAAQAGEVYLDPLGQVYLDGFSYYRMYLKDAIDKLGVDVNVFRAGTFKSFTDQYSRSDMAPSEREESAAWLEVLWNAYQQDVTRARSLPANSLNEYIAEEPAALAAVNGDSAKLALQRGLVTALKSRRQLGDELKGLVGEDQDNHTFNAISMNQYLTATRSKRVLKGKADARVGIVVASGMILDGHQPPGTIGGESTADLLRQARYDNTVKAVVLRVDSPGGSMFASEQILREVQALRKAGKPVIVSMSTYAASGGEPDLCESDHPDGIDRRLFRGHDLSAHARKTRREGRRARHHAVGRRDARRPHARARHAPDPADVGGARLSAVPAARGRGPQEVGRRRRQDRAGTGLGRRRRAAHRTRRSSRRSEGRHRCRGEARRTARRL
jgi:protease IV